ncbi:hypothetical protein LCGC14_2126460 [marine sediment metagenome]|uniref:Uncharacterized protein n=1 Tax=marine sediment metagenome TaxID=412755 RepID=A0A0F9EPY2_9ZZZZ
MRMKALLSIVLLALLISLPTVCLAAIGFDTSTEIGDVQVDTSSGSWSHTCTGSDLILAVVVTMRANNSVSDITYNSVSLTHETGADQDANNVHTEVWYLINPATGSNTVEVTLSASTNRWWSAAISLTGVAQSSPVDASGGSTDLNVPAISTTLTVNTADSWGIDVWAHEADATAATADSGQTERQQSNANFLTGSTSTEGPLSTGSQAMGWTGAGGTGNAAQTMVVFKPAVAAAAVRRKVTVY